MSPTGVVDYREVVVNKPWGYEYLMYQNDQIGIWYLHIDHGRRTSLHCHPYKKTGLILLSGEAVVTFLNDSVGLKAPKKLMIRSGLFHSTAAVSPEGIVVIEVETPRDKGDLVRFEDEYGREEMPYEGPDKQVPISDKCIQFDRPEDGRQLTYKTDGCVLTLQRTNDIRSLGRQLDNEIILVLEGGLYSRTGEPVLAAGDVISPDTLNRLTEKFSSGEGISLLTIRKEE